MANLTRRLKQRRVIAGVGAVAVILGVVMAVRLFRAPTRPPRLGPLAGAAMARALATTLAATPTWRVPTRCMEPDEATGAGAPLVVGARTYAWTNGQLTGGDAAAQKLRLGVVADARGAGAETLRATRALVDELTRTRIDVLVSLGGLGRTREEIEAVLDVLRGDGSWLVIALPGDREDTRAHHEAVLALAARGAAIVDGAALGVVVVDGVAIGLVPGAPADGNGRAHGLVAGADGCARAAADLAWLEQRLTAVTGPHVLAAHRPPRQLGLAGTDLAEGGVHVGEPALAQLAAHVGAVAFVHADVDETSGRSVRADGLAPSSPVSTMTWSDRLVVSVGPLEDLPRRLVSGERGFPAASTVEIDHMRARVRPVRASARNPRTLQ